jgi:sarcosine oxidase subunit delta
MSFLIPCPNCGPRSVDEYRFGGELRPKPVGDVPVAVWRAYLYERRNFAGLQREWWYHRHGCRRWFVAVRDTITNIVVETAWYSEEKEASHA